MDLLHKGADRGELVDADTTPPNGQTACRLALDRNGMPPPLSARVWLTEIRAIRAKKHHCTTLRIQMLRGRKSRGVCQTQ